MKEFPLIPNKRISWSETNLNLTVLHFIKAALKPVLKFSAVPFPINHFEGGIELRLWLFLMIPHLSTSIKQPFTFHQEVNHSRDGKEIFCQSESNNKYGNYFPIIVSVPIMHTVYALLCSVAVWYMLLYLAYWGNHPYINEQLWRMLVNISHTSTEV